MANKRNGDNRWFICFLLLFALFFLLTFAIWPLKDDWNYVKYNVDPVTLLLPEATFWRPFDGLLGAVDGLLPARWFPILNRVFVCLAHVLNGFLVGMILEKLRVRRNIAILSGCLFLFSSAAVATWVSPDGVAQAYSVLFGLIALYLAMTKSGYWYLVFLFLSLFWKEPGISWFFIVMLFQLYVSRPLKAKRIAAIILIPAISIGIYFCARFALQGSISLGNPDIDRYQLSLFSLSTVTNFFKLTGLSFGGIDTIALFSSQRNLVLVGITGLLSVPFVVVLITGMIRVFRQKKKEDTLMLIVLLLSLILLTGPLILMDSVGEMHAYGTLGGAMILAGWLLERAELISYKWVKAALICLFAAFAITTIHKLATIYQYSSETENLTKEIYQNYQNPEESLLLVVYNEPEDYSVFTQPPIDGTAGGTSLHRYFGWGRVPVDIERITSDDECEKILEEKKGKYDHVLVVKGTGVWTR